MAYCAAEELRDVGSTDVAVASSALALVPPGSPEMERDRLLISEMISQHDDIALRTCRPGHLTGSAAVLDPSGATTLLLMHTKLRRWLQPGGHADGETALASVALREAVEETGLEGLRIDPVPIDLDIHLVDPPAEDAHLHLDVRYLVVAPAADGVRANDESTDHRWVEIDRLADFEVDAGLVRMVAAARERLRSSG